MTYFWIVANELTGSIPELPSTISDCHVGELFCDHDNARLSTHQVQFSQICISFTLAGGNAFCDVSEAVDVGCWVDDPTDTTCAPSSAASLSAFGVAAVFGVLAVLVL